MERTLIATTPAAMEVACKQMAVWAKAKLADVHKELAELRQELAIAKQRKWATAGITRRLKREGKRLDFYAKIRKALEAGYYVVPNMPADAFAIRTDAKKARKETTEEYVTRWDFMQPVRMLPEGEGRYVAPKASHRRIEDTKEERSNGSTRRVKNFGSADLEPVDFPVALMKPEAMDATGKAMALKLFDEILECRDAARCGDPMVLGRIRNPRAGRPDLTFFIAWVMPLDRI